MFREFKKQFATEFDYRGECQNQIDVKRNLEKVLHSPPPTSFLEPSYAGPLSPHCVCLCMPVQAGFDVIVPEVAELPHAHLIDVHLLRDASTH